MKFGVILADSIDRPLLRPFGAFDYERELVSAADSNIGDHGNLQYVLSTFNQDFTRAGGQCPVEAC